jgi:hypothetical protein
MTLSHPHVLLPNTLPISTPGFPDLHVTSLHRARPASAPVSIQPLGVGESQTKARLKADLGNTADFLPLRRFPNKSNRMAKKGKLTKFTCIRKANYKKF